MLDFKLFRRRNFAAANLETFLVYGALYGQLVYVQLYLQFLGFSPFEASLLGIPASVIMIVLAARFGALADRQGPRLYLTAGPALIGCSLLLLLFVRTREEFWYAGVPSLLLFAFGLAMMVAPITATALKSAPEEAAGIASGINSTVSRLGSLLTVAVIGLVISLVFERRVGDAGAVPLARGQADEALRDASISAFHIGMLLAAGLAFAGAAVAALWISDREARGELSEQAPAPAGN
jgi:predicted MFS family arabinose efflux permease